jgi:hypothetical protein
MGIDTQNTSNKAMTYIQLAYCTIQNNISFQILSWWLITMEGLNAANWLGSGHPLLKLIYIDLRYLP